jgi:glycosyltransferase involved in cell wall biosynthesis
MDCRILYIVGQLRAGGLERQLCYLLKAMDRDRYRPAVAVWRFREDDVYVRYLRQMQVPIFSPLRGTSGFGKLRWICDLAKQLDPEVIHSYSFHTNFGAWYASFKTNATSVGSVRSDIRYAMLDCGFCLGHLCLRWPRTQIINSFSAAKEARRLRGPFVPKQTVVVRNAVDLEYFTPTPMPNCKRPTVVGIGSLFPVKRWDRFLMAAYRLRQQGLDFSVRILGEGPQRESLQERTKDLKLRDCVEFIGQSDNVPALLSEATFLAHTSDSEGCPNVVMEAMACGRPVVATDAGDAPYLVEDGKTGFVVRRGDDNALRERIGILIKNRGLCERMGERARERAEADFGLERLVKGTLAAYRRAGWRDDNSALIADDNPPGGAIAV